MTTLYSKFRFCLMTFAFGLAAVYAWAGYSIEHDQVPVDLPKVAGTDNVLFIFPTGPQDNGYGSREDRLAQIIGNRDLSSYDLGTYAPTCDFEETLADCLALRQDARDFIYSHLRDKRKGYIKVGFPCVDCGPIDHFFIEPDQYGRWKTVITLDTNGPLRTSTATSVTFRKPTKDERFEGHPSRVLSLVNVTGHEIEAF